MQIFLFLKQSKTFLNLFSQCYTDRACATICKGSCNNLDYFQFFSNSFLSILYFLLSLKLFYFYFVSMFDLVFSCWLLGTDKHFHISFLIFFILFCYIWDLSVCIYILFGVPLLAVWHRQPLLSFCPGFRILQFKIRAFMIWNFHIFASENIPSSRYVHLWYVFLLQKTPLSSWYLYSESFEIVK